MTNHRATEKLVKASRHVPANVPSVSHGRGHGRGWGALTKELNRIYVGNVDGWWPLYMFKELPF